MDKEIAELQSTLQSPGWLGTVIPAIEARLRAMEAAQDDPDLARRHRLPDDYIRGEKVVLKWFRRHFNDLVQYSTEDSEQEALASLEQSVYDDRARLGFSYPGGTTPPVNGPVR